MARPIPGIELYCLTPIDGCETRRRFDWPRMAADGQVWQLSANEGDFGPGEMRSVQVLAWRWAQRNGHQVRMYKAGEDVLRVQFSPRVHADV